MLLVVEFIGVNYSTTSELFSSLFLLFSQPLANDTLSSQLTIVQQRQVEQMTLNEDLRTVYLLSQEFVTLLKERQVEVLDSWLTRAKACHVTTEGQVNRLKFLKRQMFGRAHLDLLRVKVLHAV